MKHDERHHSLNSESDQLLKNLDTAKESTREDDSSPKMILSGCDESMDLDFTSSLRTI